MERCGIQAEKRKLGASQQQSSVNATAYHRCSLWCSSFLLHLKPSFTASYSSLRENLHFHYSVLDETYRLAKWRFHLVQLSYFLWLYPTIVVPDSQWWYMRVPHSLISLQCDHQTVYINENSLLSNDVVTDFTLCRYDWTLHVYRIKKSLSYKFRIYSHKDINIPSKPVWCSFIPQLVMYLRVDGNNTACI